SLQDVDHLLEQRVLRRGLLGWRQLEEVTVIGRVRRVMVDETSRGIPPCPWLDWRGLQVGDVVTLDEGDPLLLHPPLVDRFSTALSRSADLGRHGIEATTTRAPAVASGLAYGLVSRPRAGAWAGGSARSAAAAMAKSTFGARWCATPLKPSIHMVHIGHGVVCRLPYIR